MTNIAIFASGSGTNAENIINYFEGSKEVNISLIISNKEDAYVHQRAKKHNIPSFTFTYSEFKDSTAILKLLNDYHIDFIVLAGFMIKVSPQITNLYSNKIINIHPALLPKYGGKGMYGDNVHKAVAENKEKETGITIHYVNENYDEGNIIYQAKCSIDDSDNYTDIANKVHELEYKYFPETIKRILQNKKRDN